MKKSVLLSALIGLSYFSTAQITVPQEQKSMYAVVEATWCGNCGQFGIPTTANVISQVGSKAVFFNLHRSSSSALHSPVAAAIAASIGTSGQPYWTLNGVGYGGHTGTLETTIINDINNTYSATTTDANVGYNWNVLGDTVYIETLTEFFSNLNGDYYMALYISEDDIYAYQSNYDPMIPSGNIYHDHILRTSVSGNAFGTLISSGAVSAGTTFSNNHKIYVDPSWNSANLHVTAVLWRDNGSGYDFVNANGDGVNSTSIEENEMSFNFTVYPNPASDLVNITFSEAKSNLSLSIFDITGKVVRQEQLSNSGQRTLQLNLSGLSSGVYYVNLTGAEGSTTQKIIVE